MCDTNDTKNKCVRSCVTHVLQEEMFLRGIQAEHWIQATLPVVSRKKKKEHDRYLNRMATATALACMDMTRHVHVRYDVAGRPVVCFNKEVVVKEAYVVWEYGKDVKVKVTRTLTLSLNPNPNLHHTSGLRSSEGLLVDVRGPQERMGGSDSLHGERRRALPLSGNMSHIFHLCVYISHMSHITHQVSHMIPISHTTRPSPLSAYP